MKRRLIISIILCCACSLLLWMKVESRLIGIMAIIVSLISLKFNIKIKYGAFSCVSFMLLLAIFFVGKSTFALSNASANNILYKLLLTNLCECLIVLMVFSLLFRRNDHIGSWFAIFCILITALLDKVGSATGKMEYALAMVIVCGSFVFWFSSETAANIIGSKRLRNIMTFSILCFAVLANQQYSEILYSGYCMGCKYVFSKITVLYNSSKLQELSSGFDLSEKKIATKKISLKNMDDVVIQIVGNKAPKYLIGKIYDEYHNGKWSSNEKYDLIMPDERFENDGGRNVFIFDSHLIQETGFVCDIKCFDDFDGVVFSVNDTVAVGIEAPSLLYSNNGDILCHNQISQTYRIYSSVNKAQTSLSDEKIKRLKQVPLEIRDSIDEIVKEVFSDSMTTHEKVSALFDFWNGAIYSMNPNIPDDEEPILFMIKNRPSAHCELFASASCMMLRVADVPTRYVTGFTVDMVQEGCLVVKNKNAHAWVQIWDSEALRWVDVDIPTSLRADILSGSSDIDGNVSKFKKHVFVCCFGFFVTIISIVGYLLCRALLNKSRYIGRKCEIVKMQKKLFNTDKQLVKRGLVRKSSETTMQFAIRLEQTGPCYSGRNEHIEWYKLYSEMRYSNPAKNSSSKL